MAKEPLPNTRAPAPTPPALLEALLAVHSAPNHGWLADAVSSAAERSLGALYSFLFLADASGWLAGVRPASSERIRGLVKVQQALDVNLTTLRFNPQEHPVVLSVLQEDRVVAVPKLSQALHRDLDPTILHAAQRSLGVADSWLTPLRWTGENWGLLLLLMPANAPASIQEAGLLGRHIALALANLREKETSRKQGELDLVRSVYDEQRFLEQLAQEIRRSQRHNRPLSVMLLQVQNLAKLQARYGRFLADQVLRHVGDLLLAAKRDTDFLGASSNDGFATILVEADQEGARRAKERLLASLESAKLPNIDLPDLHIKLACATATLQKDGDTAEELAATAAARLIQNEPVREDAA